MSTATAVIAFVIVVLAVNVISPPWIASAQPAGKVYRVIERRIAVDPRADPKSHLNIRSGQRRVFPQDRPHRQLGSNLEDGAILVTNGSQHETSELLEALDFSGARWSTPVRCL